MRSDLGAIYLLIYGESGEQVYLFLIVVGTLITVNQIFLGNRVASDFSGSRAIPETRFASGD
jgi:hypothetical protein